MKKSFSYNLTQFGAAGNTVTEQIKTSDGVKTITTDANTGAVILSDQVDEDSLNPVTGAAVATAIAQGGGGVPEYGESDAGKVLQVDAQGDDLVWAVAGGAYTAGNGIRIDDVDGEIAVALGSGGIQVDLEDNSLMISDEYGLVHVEDGAILVNHDDTISETSDPDGHGRLSVSVPVPTVAYADTGKVLGVVDGSTASLGWVSAGGSVVTDSNAPFKGAGTAASPLGFNIDSDSLNVSATSIGPLAYADAKFTGNSAIGTLLDTSGTVTMQFTGLSWPGNPGDSAYILLTYGSNNSIASRTSGRIANDRSVTLTIDVHNADTRYGTWTADSTLYTIKIWDVQESSYAPYTNVTIVDTNKRLQINRPVPAAQSADNGKVLSVTDSSGSIGWANVPSDLPSYTSGDWGKVLSVKQESQGSSSSVVEWASIIPGGQTLGSASASAAGSTLSVTCDTSKSALYKLVCVVPHLRVDDSIVNPGTEYYLELGASAGVYVYDTCISIKFYMNGNAAWSDGSAVAYIRQSDNAIRDNYKLSNVLIAALKNTDGTSVTGDWLLSGSNIYVYGLA